jgi:uncharacterized protein YceH (UPF0502 family)
MLRGPQTPGELKQRSDRMHSFPSLTDVDAVLTSLEDRQLVAAQPRAPGQKETRYAQLLGSTVETQPSMPGTPAPGDRVGELEERLARVEEKLAELFEALDLPER